MKASNGSRRTQPLPRKVRSGVVDSVTVRSLRILAVPLGLILLTGCGGNSGGNTAATTPSAPTAVSSRSAGSPSTPATSGPEITISGFAFGAPLTVKAGTKITVKNSDGVEHTVTADDGNSFNVSAAPGGITTFTAPSKPGTYKFHCSLHPQMHGTLTVTA